MKKKLIILFLIFSTFCFAEDYFLDVAFGTTKAKAMEILSEKGYSFISMKSNDREMHYLPPIELQELGVIEVMYEYNPNYILYAGGIEFRKYNNINSLSLLEKTVEQYPDMKLVSWIYDPNKRIMNIAYFNNRIMLVYLAYDGTSSADINRWTYYITDYSNDN